MWFKIKSHSHNTFKQKQNTSTNNKDNKKHGNFSFNCQHYLKNYTLVVKYVRGN